MSTLSQFSGFREIPLIPDFDEPAFNTAGYGSRTQFTYNQNAQMVGYQQDPSGEFGSYFSASWSSTPSSSNSWTYSGTSLCGPHGHLYGTSLISIDSGAYAQQYVTGSYSNNGNYYGVLNSQATGVWVNKTKRDNLCLQFVNNGSDYDSYEYKLHVSTLGFGAIYCPIAKTVKYNSSGSGAAYGYTTARSYGLVGYNETTKTFAIVSNAVSGTATMFVYQGVQPPTLANTNDQTFWNQFNTLELTKKTVTFTFPNVSGTHDYQHYKIFPLDNGNIALVYKWENNYISYHLFTGNNGVDSTSWTFGSTAVLQVGTTTSFHDSGFSSFDYLPAIVSHDGKYVFIWTQYYYYQTGICGIAVRVSDGQCRYIQFTDSTYAYSVATMQKNVFAIGQGTNSDGGAGQRLLMYDFDTSFAETANTANITSKYSQIAVDEPYTSTNYGMIWQAISYLPNFIRGIF